MVGFDAACGGFVGEDGGVRKRWLFDQAEIPMSDNAKGEEITLMSMLISQAARISRLERLAVRLRDDLIALNGGVPTMFVHSEENGFEPFYDLEILNELDEGEPD
jgi:hypothetical protein